MSTSSQYRSSYYHNQIQNETDKVFERRTVDRRDTRGTRSSDGTVSTITSSANSRESSGTAMTEGPAYSKKIVVVGDGGCGKTCLLISYSQGYFPEVCASNIFTHSIFHLPRLRYPQTFFPRCIPIPWDPLGWSGNRRAWTITPIAYCPLSISIPIAKPPCISRSFVFGVADGDHPFSLEIRTDRVRELHHLPHPSSHRQDGRVGPVGHGRSRRVRPPTSAFVPRDRPHLCLLRH